jgi:hypothetical protein
MWSNNIKNVYIAINVYISIRNLYCGWSNHDIETSVMSCLLSFSMILIISILLLPPMGYVYEI